VLNFVKSEGKRISIDSEGNYEFIIPEIIPTHGGQKVERVTFNREKGIGEPKIQFMALGHYITDAIIKVCSGYGYGGKCVKRQITDSPLKGEAGIQLNFTIEYLAPQPGQQKNKTVQKEFQVIIFDAQCKYRKDLEELCLIEGERKINEKDFSFVTKRFLEEVETAANQKIQEIIDGTVQALQPRYQNVIYRKNLENVALFVVK